MVTKCEVTTEKTFHGHGHIGLSSNVAESTDIGIALLKIED